MAETSGTTGVNWHYDIMHFAKITHTGICTHLLRKKKIYCILCIDMPEKTAAVYVDIALKHCDLGLCSHSVFKPNATGTS